MFLYFFSLFQLYIYAQILHAMCLTMFVKTAEAVSLPHPIRCEPAVEEEEGCGSSLAAELCCTHNLCHQVQQLSCSQQGYMCLRYSLNAQVAQVCLNIMVNFSITETAGKCSSFIILPYLHSQVNSGKQ